MSRQDVTIRAVQYSGLGATWFTDYVVGNPQLLVQAEDWGLLANGGLNHAGDFAATFEDYFSTRAGQGYTSWYGSWCSFTGMDGGRNGSDSDGTFPFSTNMNPSTSPTSTFWARRDSLISVAANHGIRIMLNVTTPYIHRTDANEPPQRTWTQTQWQDFGTFLGNRYKNMPNILWVIGDDYFDDINTNLNAWKTALRATGDAHPTSIQYAQEGGSRVDYHSGGGAKAMAAFADFNFGYSYNVAYLITEGMGNEASPIPYSWLDGFFLNEEPHINLTDVQLMRRHIWWAVSSGSKGFVTGDADVWPWASTALAQLTSKTFYTTVVPAIVSYFEALPGWHLLKADTSNLLVTAGRGTKWSLFPGDSFYGEGGASGNADSDVYVTASRVSDGSLAVIYASKGGTITIDETKMVGSYTATWVDPKTCATTAATPGTTYNFTAKGNNSDGLNEWVLVLKGP